MRSIRSGFLLLALLTLASNLLPQQSSMTVPNLIRYGGVLKDARGATMSSRTVGITFLIYGQQDGGAPVWLETQNVATDAAGQYNVLLGSTAATGLPSDLFAQQEQRWLAVKAEGQPEQPRVLLVSVPYAMKAAEADRLAGHSVSEFVTTDNLQSAVQQQLQGQAATVTAGAPAATNGTGTSAGSAPVPTNPATNFVDNTTNQVVLVTQNGTGFGLNASASTPTGVGVLGTVSSSPKAGISAGVEGTSSINNGFGIFGYSTATTGGVGVQGRSDSSNGTGVRGWTIGTSGIAVNATSSATTGNPVGLYASVSAPGGTGALIANTATGTVTGPLINALTNNVTQFAVGATGNVSATGWLSGKQLISTVATGTAALQVASTTQVPNLNASLLGGNAASAFALTSGSPNYIQNGTVQQASANFNIGGNGSANSFNSATTYGIGGNAVMSIGSPADQNSFFGVGAGVSDVAGQGLLNTFSGYQAGYANTTGGGNVFTGATAGQFNSTGNGNVFAGIEAGYYNTAGSNNVFVGSVAGVHNTTGGYNVFIGGGAGLYNTTAHSNVFVGQYAGLSNTTGVDNVMVGADAGYNPNQQSTSGTFNTFVGVEAGENIVSGNMNIYIGERAGSVADESNTIRIGNLTDQTAAYIAGIYGATSSGGVAVYINSNGQLGTLTSSLRFKEQVRDMGDSTNALMKLRPVTFLYKPEYDKGPRTMQYGLIAEEVAEVYPDLVAYEADGKPYTVKYQYLTTMLLNEMQKQHAVVAAQREEIDSLKAQLRLQNATFQERLSRLESMVGTQTQIAADLQQQ